MVLPAPVPILTTSSESSLSDDETIRSIVRSLSQQLSEEMPTLNTYRDYYDGDQSLAFGEEKFRQEFGEAFSTLRDNWCGVVVDAIADRLEMEGLSFEESTDAIQTSVWNIFRDNDIDEQQEDLHEGALVEGRSAIIVWPDPKLGARIDWQPAQNVIVRYADDDWRVPMFALKQWISANGDTLSTLYARDFIYKFIGSREFGRRPTPSPLTQIPSANSVGLQRRLIPGEPWPLPNPLNEVPVVEFINKGGSELSKIIPLQDAVNYLMVSALGASGFAALSQWVVFSAANEPVGGWEPAPGRVWQFPPTLDADGKPMPQSMGVFPAANLSQFRELVEMSLQHVALISKTPVRMFFHSDRGGRGDAPSGESLIVDDEPLLDKVEKRQTRFGNSWLEVARLVAKAAKISTPDNLRGEARWKDARAKYRTLLLDEAQKMWEIGKMKTGETRVGIPMDYIITQLALPPDDVARLQEDLVQQEEEIAQAEEEALKQEQASQEAQLQVQRERNEAQANQPQPPSQPRPSSR